MALLLAGLGLWAVGAGRSAPAGGRSGAAPTGRRALVVEVARLDEAFAALEAPTSEERGAYEARRRDLLRRLASLG
jgi:hypothetical protein